MTEKAFSKIAAGLTDAIKLAGNKLSLLPCPFCGGEAHLGSQPGGAFVNCTECMASTNVLTGIANSEEDAVAAWNRRAQ